MIRVTRIGRVAAAVAAGAVLMLVAGCSWYPDPPDDVVAEAERYGAALEAVDGVAEVVVDVRDLDMKDKPGVWVTHAVVDAASPDDLAALPGLLAAVEPPKLSQLVLVARFPATDTLASVVLSVGAELATPAEALRALPFVQRVILDGVDDSVTLEPGTDLVTAVDAIRRAAPWSVFADLRVGWDDRRLSVSVSATTPSPELLTLLDELELDPDVDRVSFRLGGEYSRPSIIIDALEPGTVARLLNAFVLQNGDVPARFTVWSDDDEITGCLGRAPC